MHGDAVIADIFLVKESVCSREGSDILNFKRAVFSNFGIQIRLKILCQILSYVAPELKVKPCKVKSMLRVNVIIDKKDGHRNSFYTVGSTV